MDAKVSDEVFNEGMKLSDFKVGETFWTATGQWVVNEIDGERVFATRANVINQTMTEFDDSDFGGCYPTKEALDEDIL